METYPALYEIAKVLLSEEDPERTHEILFQRALEATGAERGFVVVKEGDSFEEKLHQRFDRNALSADERRFSRTLVRRAIESRQVIYSPNIAEDERFAEAKSVQALGLSSVLVAPMHHGGEVFGVVYLERRGALGGSAEEMKLFLTEFAEVAGLCIRRAIEREALRRRSRSLERDLFAQHDFEGIVTRHPRMLALLKTVAQVADAQATVLVHGETGTGKELVARALHLNSGRRNERFVTLHCTALPGTVLESELFGHTKGAFTGADKDRAGRIASAHGGTLFLDEIAEIPAEVQAKLLRFLQFGEIQRLGSDRTERVDVRIVAATHRNLAKMVEEGTFRQDLYFRLKVIELEIPPLRERRSDIALLTDHFVRTYWRRKGEEPRWTGEAEALLLSHDYPGNVRELGHLVERACLLATGPELGVSLFPPEMAGAGASAGRPSARRFEEFTNDELQRVRETVVADAEREFLAGLLERSGGNVSLAARHANMQRSYLQKLIARHRD